MTDVRSHPVLGLIHGRISVERFDAGRPVSEQQIGELVEDAVQAPSSFNIQHWRFVAVRTPEDRKRLRAVAYDQSVVSEAAVTFIVLGDVEAHRDLAEILEPAVEAGIITPRRARRWVEQAGRAYADERMARDEAIRSAALAAMIMMISAAARGMASTPLIGFDPEGVKREFGIRERYLPVMLLAVGYPAEDNPSRKPRLGLDRVLAFDHGREL